MTDERPDERDDDDGRTERPVDPSVEQDLVDEASEESFPASDPPSYWGRETEEDRAAIGKEEPGAPEDDG